jgi:hypothetical protein
VVHFYEGLAKLYTVVGHMSFAIIAHHNSSSMRLVTNDVVSLKSISSSQLPIGGDVDPLVSQHVHAGSQQSCVAIKIQKLLHEKSKLSRKFQPVRLTYPNLGNAITKVSAFIFYSLVIARKIHKSNGK